MSGYTTHDTSELIGLTESQVRHYVRRGLLAPGRGQRNEYRFSFQDIVLLRTAKGLLDAKVSPRKAYRVLLKLQNELDNVKNLAAVRIMADGANVVVKDEDALWNAETGQGHLDFTVRELAGSVANMAERNLIESRDMDDLDSDDWYNLGLDLEEVDPERAPEAYLRAISLDPKNADAHVNLGRLHQLRGNLRRAKQHYRLALDQVDDHQLALYNLGTLFDELDELDTAKNYYQRAESVPDAHYNLARIFELTGDELAALRHMRRYRTLTEASE